MRVFVQRIITRQLARGFRRNAFGRPHLSALYAHVTNRKRLSASGALCGRQAAPAAGDVKGRLGSRPGAGHGSTDFKVRRHFEYLKSPKNNMQQPCVPTSPGRDIMKSALMNKNDESDCYYTDLTMTTVRVAVNSSPTQLFTTR